ncbi:MAG TPA: hypothetical protein VNX15_03065 [Gemmatimonadales bacterium]|nr:hypothetical protein [Gemmatimonadales bacterium]
MIRFPPTLALLLPVAVAAQTAPGRDTTVSVRDSAVRVFVDCPDFSNGCDLDFFRTEITFVNYTQNPQDADVHILITTQQTGGGGTAYTITLIGQHKFAGKADTLHYNAPPAQAADEARRAVKGVLELGLVSYAATTPLGDRLHVSYDAPQGAAAVVHDPWNYWVFNTSINGNLSGQQSFHFGSVFGSFSANRTTERWKINLSVNYNYNESDFKLPVDDTLGNEIGTETVSSFTRGYGANAMIVRSVGRHWGIGAVGSVNNSTFSNQRLWTRVAPALEYDFFPYSQSTRQLITLHYELGASWFDYYVETLYGKTRQRLFDQTLTLSATAKETWGTVNASLQGQTYLYDLRKNHLTFFGGTSLNLYRGLSISVQGSVSLQHDQLSIPLAGATPQEILLQQHQLASSFSYFTFFGFSFNFGSIFNNIVNPRFGSSSGGMMIMM